jgi:hypothetical protein
MPEYLVLMDHDGQHLRVFQLVFFCIILIHYFIFLQSIDNLKDELTKVFSAQPSGLLVNGEKYIFIRNQDNFAVLRKGADGMVIVKLNQGNKSK